MKRLALASAIAVIAASSNIAAHAGDWDGSYVGLDLSHLRGQDKGTEYDATGTTPNGWGQYPRPRGTGIGVRGGHDWPIGEQLVFGIEGAYAHHGARGSAFQYVLSTGGDCAPATDCSFTTELRRSLSLRTRVGYLTSSRFMVFATAGLTRVNVRRTVHDGWSALAGDHPNEHAQQGLEWGLGVEYRLSQRFSSTLTYRVAHLGKHRFATPAFDGASELFKLRTTELALGLNYRF